ncbi:MAG: hypothetical protein P1S60_15170, partial [Anaerolineae bacterium]|nr:hypothetical protein [Anaerolineae bacterium]
GVWSTIDGITGERAQGPEKLAGFAPCDPTQGLRNCNAITGNSGLPHITEETLEGILNRDAFALPGIT